MQLELFRVNSGPQPRHSQLLVSGRLLSLEFVRHRRARRYILRLHGERIARVTIPRGGSLEEGRRFAERSRAWLERQLRKPSQPPAVRELRLGGTILFRGEPVQVRLEGAGNGCALVVGSERMPLPGDALDLRPWIEAQLRRLAERELPARLMELATANDFSPARVVVRAQRTRWGSCSRHGTISLNWRLVQTPEFVRDYIILHELAHLRHMNHSRRFWSEVARICPDFQRSEKWLRTQSRQLL